MKQTAITAAAALIALFSVTTAVDEFSSARAETSRMKAAAAAFPADPEWVRTANVVHPEAAFVCMDTNPCASLQSNWDVGGEISLEKLQQFGKDAGWNMATEGDCLPKPHQSGQVIVCAGTAQVEGYAADVWVTSMGKGKSHQVSLHLEKTR